MAYETGTATNMQDLVDKLFTFATGLSTTPWTEDELDLANDWGTLHRGGCYVSFRWDSTDELGIYQSLSWGAANEPHEQPDDSGEGAAGTPTSGRRVNFESAGPYTAYHFFAGEGSTPYIHVVVEVDSGRFRHFGFGNLIKHGTWTGGEYVYGHFWSQGSTAIDNPANASHGVGLEGMSSAVSVVATLHMEDYDDQTASEKWAVFSGAAQPVGTDRAGEDRKAVVGGWRGGMWGRYLAWMRYSSPNAYKPFVPLPVVYFDRAATPDTVSWIGEQPDVTVMNISAFTAGQEVVIGSDTWMVFPLVRKQYLLANTEESWMAGMAYKKIT